MYLIIFLVFICDLIIFKNITPKFSFCFVPLRYLSWTYDHFQLNFLRKSVSFYINNSSTSRGLKILGNYEKNSEEVFQLGNIGNFVSQINHCYLCEKTPTFFKVELKIMFYFSIYQIWQLQKKWIKLKDRC